MNEGRNFSLLMRRAKEGDEEAFSLLYQAYFSPIYRYIYFRVNDQAMAEDLTQAVFLKVFEKLPAYEERNRPPLAYFFTIARNKVIDYWRKNKEIKFADQEKILAQVPDYQNSVERSLVKSEAAKIINQALLILPEVQQQVIIWRYLNEMDYGEIAKLLGKKEEAVRKIQSRALAKLREYFKDNNIYER
jgi:RNA polymerase sigma-70 factor (ECF subfamily)